MRPRLPDRRRVRFSLAAVRKLALLPALAASHAVLAGGPCLAGDGPNFSVTNNGFSDYVINGANDPGLTVVRGCSYTFNVNAVGHPFLIKTVQGSGLLNTYNDGVTNNGVQNGALSWTVPIGAPDSLFYNCQFHAAMTGTITVIDAPPTTILFADGFEDIVR